MTYDEIKKWLEDNNYQNSGLRTDRNHRIDLYLSDVLFDFAQQQVKNLNIPAVMQRSEQLIDFLTWYAQKIEDNFTEQFKEQLVKDYLKSINCA